MEIYINELFNLEIIKHEEEESEVYIKQEIGVNGYSYIIELYDDLSINTIYDPYGYDINELGYDYNNMVDDEIKKISNMLYHPDVIEELPVFINDEITIKTKNLTLNIEVVQNTIHIEK